MVLAEPEGVKDPMLVCTFGFSSHITDEERSANESLGCVIAEFAAPVITQESSGRLCCSFVRITQPSKKSLALSTRRFGPKLQR